MAETSYPWQTGSGTAVDEAKWASMGGRYMPSGVIGATTRDAADTSLLTTLGGGPGGPTFTVAAGEGVVAGVRYDNSASLVKTGTNNASGNPRIDRLVLKKDTAAKTVVAFILQGTAASTPVPPAVTGSGTVTYETVARGTIAAGGNTYTNLVDERRFVGIRHLVAPSTAPIVGVQAGDSWYWADKRERVEYDGTVWRGTRTRKYAGELIGPLIPNQFNMTAAPVTSTFAKCVIADPGYPYLLTCSAHANVGALGAGNYATANLRLGASPTVGTILATTTGTAVGALDAGLSIPEIEPVALTGAQTVWFNIIPAVAGFFLWDGTTNWLSVTITPDPG